MEDTAELVILDDLKSWITYEDENLLVVNKPGWLVCHPSKNGPLSSLVGACKIYTDLETLHLVSRLDRETSGVVILAKNKYYARKYQMAFQNRIVSKTYIALLEGDFIESCHVRKHLARDMESQVYVKQVVRKSNSSKMAETLFEPLTHRNNYSIVKVTPITGRKHQIRAHAKWMGYPVVGDKVYGSDDTLYLEFIEHGWTERLEKTLAMRRQALHAFKITFNFEDEEVSFIAPVPEDMEEFCLENMGVKINENLLLK